MKRKSMDRMTLALGRAYKKEYEDHLVEIRHLNARNDELGKALAAERVERVAAQSRADVFEDRAARAEFAIAREEKLRVEAQNQMEHDHRRVDAIEQELQRERQRPAAAAAMTLADVHNLLDIAARITGGASR